MNSYERVIAALERRQPDRVPYIESVIDLNLMQALVPGCDYYQFNEWLGMDSVGQNRSSWSRDNVQYVDKEKGLFRDKWGVTRAFGPESTPAPVEGPIKRPEDLKTYTPPDPEAPDVLGTIPEIVSFLARSRAASKQDVLVLAGSAGDCRCRWQGRAHFAVQAWTNSPRLIPAYSGTSFKSDGVL